MQESRIFLRPSVLDPLLPSGHGTIMETFLTEDGLGSELPVFSPDDDQCLLVAGATGIVGFDKTLQFASRLYKHGVRVIAIDLPSQSFDWSRARKSLSARFDSKTVNEILQSITFMNTDPEGRLTDEIKKYDVKMVFEAIPERVDIKQAFFKDARNAWSTAILLSATSGFQAQVLFDGIENAHFCTIAHPSFPHLTNLWFEIVMPGSDAPIDQETYESLVRLFLQLGLIPKAVKDVKSFVLDRIFCSLLNQCLRFMDETHLTPQQVDSLCQEVFGPNVLPFFAHDMIAKAGGKCSAANVLTLSCLKDLDGHYDGNLFTPHPKLLHSVQVVEDGHDFQWYCDVGAGPALREGDRELFKQYVLGGLAIVVSQIISEGVADFETINGITEGCTLFSKGIIVLLQEEGEGNVVRLAENAIELCDITQALYHHQVFIGMEKWMVYVNAEISTHSDGELIGHVTMSRASYCWRLNVELNTALDWLRDEGVKRVMLSCDFATSSQFGVGADTTVFKDLNGVGDARNLSMEWTQTACRFRNDFDHSIAVITKRAWGGMLELALHSHTVVAVDGATIRFPEVTIRVVPGMNGLHLPFRRVPKTSHGWVYGLLMNGEAEGVLEALNKGLINFVCSRAQVVRMIGEALENGVPEFQSDTFQLHHSTLNMNPPASRRHERGFVQAYSHDCRSAIANGVEACRLRPWADDSLVSIQAGISAYAMYADWGFLGKKK